MNSLVSAGSLTPAITVTPPALTQAKNITRWDSNNFIDRDILKLWNDSVIQNKLDKAQKSIPPACLEVSRPTMHGNVNIRTNCQIYKEVPEGWDMGIASSKCRRESLTDRFFTREFNVINGKTKRNYTAQVFGVLSGLRGTGAADFAAKHLMYKIETYLCVHLSRHPIEPIPEKVIWNALKYAFEAIDEEFYFATNGTDLSGTIANVVLIIDGNIWCANLGTSQAILKPQAGTTIPLSFALTPQNDGKSIRKRGGVVEDNALTNLTRTCHLYQSRVIGSVDFKGINPRPKILKTPIQPGFLVLGSKGFWEVMSNGEVTCGLFLNKHHPTAKIAANLVEIAEKKEAQNNITVLVLRIPGKNLEDDQKSNQAEKDSADHHNGDSSLKLNRELVSTENDSGWEMIDHQNEDGEVCDDEKSDV